MIWLIAPVATFAIKKYISSEISDAVYRGINEGVGKAKSQARCSFLAPLFAAGDLRHYAQKKK